MKSSSPSGNADVSPAFAEAANVPSGSSSGATSVGLPVASMAIRSLALLLTMAIFSALLRATEGRGIDLSGFLLVVALIATVTAFVIQSRSLYLAVQSFRMRARGLPDSISPDRLSSALSLAIWQDGLMRSLLAGALSANLALFAYVSARYSSLPPFLPLHYSAAGEVDRLGTAGEVFMMPAIGAVVLLANLLLAALTYQRERLAGYMVTGASIFVQIVLLVATANIITRA